MNLFVKTTASTKSSKKKKKKKNSVKISTKSMKTLINNYDKNILGKKRSINRSICNCRNEEPCPLNGQCQIGEVVYEGTLSSN